jgi:choline kinase
MALLLNIALDGRSKILDSGGSLVEIGDLAQEIATQLPGIRVLRDQINHGFEDTYFPEPDEYEAECDLYGFSPMSLSKQVETTIQSHRILLHSSE